MRDWRGSDASVLSLPGWWTMTAYEREVRAIVAADPNDLAPCLLCGDPACLPGVEACPDCREHNPKHDSLEDLLAENPDAMVLLSRAEERSWHALPANVAVCVCGCDCPVFVEVARV